MTVNIQIDVLQPVCTSQTGAGKRVELFAMLQYWYWCILMLSCPSADQSFSVCWHRQWISGVPKEKIEGCAVCESGWPLMYQPTPSHMDHFARGCHLSSMDFHLASNRSCLFTWPVRWRIASSLNITHGVRFSLLRNRSQDSTQWSRSSPCNFCTKCNLWGWKWCAFSVFWIDQQLTPVYCTNFHVNFFGLATSWHNTIVVFSSLVAVTDLLRSWTLSDCLNFCRILDMVDWLIGL
jgi:hypothetical protein